MNIVYAKQLNPIVESIELFSHFFNQSDYHTEKAIFEATKGKPNKELENLFHTLDKFYKHFLPLAKTLKNPAYTLLFTEIKNTRSNFAKSILYYHGDFTTNTIHEFKADILRKYRQNPNSFILSFFNNYDLLDEDAVLEGDQASLLTLLNACSLEGSEKWKVVVLQQDFEEYLNLLCNLLEKSMDIFEKYKQELLPFQEDFLQITLKTLQSEGIHSYLKRHFSLQIAMDEELHIQASVCNCGRFQYLTNKHQPSTILWGIYFEYFMPQAQHVTSDYLCGNMKVLADKSKFDILSYLANRKTYGGEIAKRFNLSTATISYHMQALISTGFISVEKESYRTFYHMNKQALSEFLGDINDYLINGID